MSDDAHDPLTAILGLLIGIVLATFLGISPAPGAPPPNADPAMSEYFQGLEVPGGEHQGWGCCDWSDCRQYTDDKVRQEGGGWEVFIDGDWRKVPPEHLITNKATPTGNYIACWTPAYGVLCFQRPTET